MDASFVEVPIQRNNREENKQIKEGKIPDEWKTQPNKLEQKDVDARWTKKNGKNYYGYKDHIKADERSKLIDSYRVTDTSVHYSQETENLLEEQDKGQGLYADSAYSGTYFWIQREQYARLLYPYHRHQTSYCRCGFDELNLQYFPCHSTRVCFCIDRSVARWISMIRKSIKTREQENKKIKTT